MTVAERVIKPTQAGVFRTIFLYTGQGETTLLVIPTGTKVTDYKYVLVDSDQDREPKEINLVKLFKDLFKQSGKLSAFINTHPHNDHIGGIKEVYDEIGFDEVWHSNHKPGPKHKDKYEDLKYVIDEVGKKKEFFLKGSNERNVVRDSKDAKVSKPLGAIDYQVLSPAEYLCEDIDDENQDTRDRRIHEQCGVIKFSYGNPERSIMITGDSDKAAWKEHITDYHKDSLPADVLSASHHGSRTFFMENKDDEDVYEEHIEAIAPSYVVISAPTQDKSPHGHPHDEAWDLYKKHVGEDNILHLGANYQSVIVDIYLGGEMEVTYDQDLVAEYGQPEEDDNDDDDGNKKDYSGIFVKSSAARLDRQKMG